MGERRVAFGYGQRGIVAWCRGIKANRERRARKSNNAGELKKNCNKEVGAEFANELSNLNGGEGESKEKRWTLDIQKRRKSEK